MKIKHTYLFACYIYKNEKFFDYEALILSNFGYVEALYLRKIMKKINNEHKFKKLTILN